MTSAFSERLSRYTPAFFACALVHLLLAEFAVTAGVTWPAQPLLAPMTLVAVHLTTLGWLTLLMFGALFQFVPVISNRPLPSQGLAFAMLVLFEVGLWMLLIGFIAPVAGAGLLLPVGGALVLLAVVLGIANLLPALAPAARRSLPARCTLVGLAALLATLLLGLCLALALRVGGMAIHIAPLLGAALPAHLLAGLLGWFTLTAVGVSYKLLPMFLLSPEERGWLGEAVFWLLAGGCMLAVGGTVGRAFTSAVAVAAVEPLGLAVAAAGVLLYLIDVARLYRQRRRRELETHNSAAIGAFVTLSLLVPAALLWQSSRLVTPAFLVALTLTGWLSGLGLTQLYKIVAFLSWLTHYGARLGSAAVPRVQELVRERRGAVGFALFFAGVVLQAAGAQLTAPAPFRVGAGLCLLGTLALAHEYWSAWRLRYVGAPAHLRRADDAAPASKDRATV